MLIGHYRSPVVRRPLPAFPERFGIRSVAQVMRDLSEVVRSGLTRRRFQFDLRSAGLLRPDLSLPAYAGLIPDDGLAPIFNLFDRTGGGQRYTQRVSRSRARDFRGGRLSYDEHDGIDFVCPIGTPLCAAAPGIVVMIRDRWLRGGLTIAVDHGHGLLTQYTHCARAIVSLGQPVERGRPLALSGAAGYDLVQFFPFIPPHIHFMVYLDGEPLDPFTVKGDKAGPGAWLVPNAPQPSGPREDDVARDASPIDETAISAAIGSCRDRRISDELSAVRGTPAFAAALLEDAITHDAWAWPDRKPGSVRPRLDTTRRTAARKIRLSLPLPGEAYGGIRFGDTWYTRPPQLA